MNRKGNQTSNGAIKKSNRTESNMQNQSTKMQELTQKIRSFLNKATLSNIKQLVNNFSFNKIDKMNKIEIIIDMMFEKIILDPNITRTYAELCSAMIDLITIEDFSHSLKFQPLKAALIKYFKKEHKRYEDSKNEFLVIRFKLRNPSYESEKEELQEAYDKIRNRTDALFRFICELYKVEMLPETLVIESVTLLIDSDTLEETRSRVLLMKEINGDDLDNQHVKYNTKKIYREFKLLNDLVEDRAITEVTKTTNVSCDMADITNNIKAPITKKKTSEKSGNTSKKSDNIK